MLFLNLYHLMVAHAQLLFGPDNYLQLVKFFNRSCYELGGGPNGSGGQDVLSLAELEHGVLRSPVTTRSGTFIVNALTHLRVFYLSTCVLVH